MKKSYVTMGTDLIHHGHIKVIEDARQLFYLENIVIFI